MADPDAKKKLDAKLQKNKLRAETATAKQRKEALARGRARQTQEESDKRQEWDTRNVSDHRKKPRKKDR